MSLGRGLGAILEEVEESYINDISTNSEFVREIQTTNIRPNPYQPRKVFDEEALHDLSASIKEHGLLQPIVVIRDDDEYILIAGERRLRATKLAGLETIRAINADIDLSKLRELALIENIQREELNPIELAQSYKELIEEYHITHEDLADIVKKSRTQVTNTLRLLALLPYTQEMIMAGKITSGHAKILLGLELDEQKKVVDTVIGQKLNVRDTESLVASLKKKREKTPSLFKEQDVDLTEIYQYLRRKFPFDTKMSENKLTLTFSSQSDVESLLKRLKK